MALARVPRHIIFAAILIVQISLTLVSVLGGLSSVLILDPNSKNIDIRDLKAEMGPSGTNLNFTFILNNTGVYDFRNINIHFNFTLRNATMEATVLEDTVHFDEILSKVVFEELIEFTPSDFTFPTDFDYMATYDFSLEITISFLYSLNLIAFTIQLYFDQTDFAIMIGG